MEQGDGAPPGFLQLCTQSMCPLMTHATVESQCKEYTRLLGLLDTILSDGGWLDACLLPTGKQIRILAAA
jgi:hypothetical protein